MSHKKRVLMASLDTSRPAAMEQLATLAVQAEVDVLPLIPGERAVAIARRAMKAGAQEGHDVVLLDTAGRLHVDEELMAECAAVRDVAMPAETLLVADALTGQDAVTIASSFHKRIGLTGIALTRVDGDGRGGAALSMRAVTGCPIKLIGVGEKLDAIEPFHPDRIASRILGMGDVVSLVERAQETIDREEAQRLARKARKGGFDLNDLSQQMQQVRKMGGMEGLLGMLPGVGKVKRQPRRSQCRHEAAGPPPGGHQLDDAGRATQPEASEQLAQAAHRRRLRHHRAGREPPAQAVETDEPDDEAGEQARREGPHAARITRHDAAPLTLKPGR